MNKMSPQTIGNINIFMSVGSISSKPRRQYCALLCESFSELRVDLYDKMATQQLKI